MDWHDLLWNENKAEEETRQGQVGGRLNVDWSECHRLSLPSLQSAIVGYGWETQHENTDIWQQDYRLEIMTLQQVVIRAKMCEECQT